MSKHVVLVGQRSNSFYFIYRAGFVRAFVIGSTVFRLALFGWAEVRSFWYV